MRTIKGRPSTTIISKPGRDRRGEARDPQPPLALHRAAGLTRSAGRGELARAAGLERLIGISCPLRQHAYVEAVQVAQRSRCQRSHADESKTIEQGRSVGARSIRHSVCAAKARAFVAGEPRGVFQPSSRARLFWPSINGRLHRCGERPRRPLQRARRRIAVLDKIGDMPRDHAGEDPARCWKTAWSRASGRAAQTALDVRIIAASNRDLAVGDARGRQAVHARDLYYRLNVVQIARRQLRERRARTSSLLAAHRRPPAGSRGHGPAARQRAFSEEARSWRAWPRHARPTATPSCATAWSGR